MAPLIEAQDLTKHFPVGRRIFGGGAVVHAVERVSFAVEEGETFCLVGESGSGKSTTARLLLRLLDPTSGRVLFDGRDLLRLPVSELRPLRRQMQMVFQDPFSSLNPRKTVRQILALPFEVHGWGRGPVVANKVLELLDVVGLRPAESFVDRYPHEFSGGQRQRIGIARAVALRPRLVVADEPVSALDVSVRAQILTLMKELQAQFHLTYVFITHDLSVVRSIATRVAVMYLGEIVELAPVADLFSKPQHPYTQALLSATPIPHPRAASAREMAVLTGEIPSPIQPPSGCRFRTRCPYAMPRCAEVKPAWKTVAEGHQVACHLRG